MKFKKSFLRALFRYCSVIIAILLIVIIIVRVGRKHPSAGYFSTRCIDYKQREFSRRLNDKIVDYSAAAKLRGVKICKNDNDLKNRISEGLLVKVRSGSGYTVEKMTYSYPYVTRDSKELIDEIAVRLREKAAQKGLRGVKFYITSMTRRTDNLRNLRRFNGNASANSPHLYGNAFDISYKRFIARKWMLTNCDIKFLKEALAEVIWQLKSENKCWATYEKVQNCFHVVAR
jgi:hypothetical protein